MPALVPLGRRPDTEWLDKMTVGELTSADGSVVTPGSQGVCDSLTGDTFRALEHVAVVTAKLHAGADSARRHRRNKCVRRHNVRGSESTAESPWCSSRPSQFIGSVVLLEPWFPRLPLLFPLVYFSPFSLFSHSVDGPAVKRAGGPAELQTGSLCDILSVKLNVSSCWHAAVCHLVGFLRHQLLLARC